MKYRVLQQSSSNLIDITLDSYGIMSVKQPILVRLHHNISGVRSVSENDFYCL